MSQLIDLGKLRFHFAGEWANSTTYESNDIVKYGGNVYVYTYALKTAGNLPTNTAYWALMIEGFKFKGVFNTATAYKVGDGIAHGGKVYVAVLDSTNQTPPNTTYWSQFADGIQYEGAYSGTAVYQKNDVVVYGGSVYIAKQDTTANDPTVTAYWDKFVEGISARGVYNAGTSYVPGDLVAYGPNIYRAKTNTTGNIPTTLANWELLVSGSKYQGVFSGSTTYYLNDVVTYGSNTYRSKQEQSVTLPTNAATWELLTQGFSHKGNWTSSTAYKINEVVTYGGSLFQALSDNQDVNPTVTATWNKIVYGFKNRGAWATATQYEIDDVVVWGGNSYIVLLPHASTVFETDLAGAKWQKFNSGIRWRGDWSVNTLYLKDDIVKDAVGSANIATTEHTSGSDFATDKTAGKWDVFVTGGADILPALQTGDAGQSLTVKGDGANLDWVGATQSDKAFYVAPHGVDAPQYGKNLAAPFASIKYATQQCGPGATIFVKTGTYNEQLPITIPSNTAIVGDNQRTVVIQPAAGNSDDGTTPNAQSTMFLMSDGSILNKMTFKGMTGWVPGATADDVTTSTIKGVVARLNPASPVVHKSPYVLECSAIGSGLIGAIIDGSVHATGAKTMIFHGYTIISDNGIGYWVKDGGKAEIVSCFTYYCYFGYTASGGGFIRSLNGNNSYGTWGATSRGFDSSETPINGTVLGQQINILYQGGNINAGDTVTSNTGATGIVTNAQISANKIYVKNTTGTFALGDTLDFTSGGEATVSAGALENQKGFVLVLTGLGQLPKPGASITLADDSFSYVIQSVTGTYVDSNSTIVVVLAQEKPTGSSSGIGAIIRYKYSQIRLTGHDFLSIGTGGITTTNYPGTPIQPAAQGSETDEAYPGRVYYVSTDQDGNFRVGEYFRIDQATGRATLNASAFDLAGLTSLKLGSIGAQLGETINEFSSDGTLSGNSNTAVPTEQAVRTYVDDILNNAVLEIQTNPALSTSAQLNKAGYYLRSDGSSSYWDSMVQISGESSFTYALGYATTLSYTATSLVVASPTFTWSLTGAPTGVTINSSGALAISNTVASGTYSILVIASDGKFTARKPLALTINADYPIFLNNEVLPTNIAPNTAVSLNRAVSTATGGVYTISSGALPTWLSLNSSTGMITGTAPSTTAASETYNFVVSVTKGIYTATKTFGWVFTRAFPQGQAMYTTPGSYSWTAPQGVTSVSVVAVGAGGVSGYSWSSGSGGGGGGLGWKNNIPVTPGQAYTVCVGCTVPPGCTCPSESYASGTQAGSSWFNSCSTVMGGGAGTISGECCATRGGTFCGDGGGCGGNSSYSWPSGSGGGAGGYSGNGGWACYGSCCPGCGGGGSAGMSSYSSTYGLGGGGGTGLFGQGTSGDGGFNPQQYCIWGNGCGTSWKCGGYGGIGGSYCNGTGLNGHTGENSCCYCYQYVGYSYPGSSCYTGESCFFNINNALHQRTGGYPGGGAGNNGSNANCNSKGGEGGVRIIWGNNRSFPSTNTGNLPTLG